MKKFISTVLVMAIILAGGLTPPLQVCAAEPEAEIVEIGQIPPVSAISIGALVKYTGTDEVVLIFAYYNGNKLMNVIQKPVVNGSGWINSKCVPQPGTCTKVKAMLWKDLDSARPLCGTKSMIWPPTVP